MPEGRRGVTLFELVVVLAVLGVVAAVAATTPPATFARGRHAPSDTRDAREARIAALRDSALASGGAVTAAVDLGGRAGTVTAYPDGRVLTDAGDVDRMTGRPRATR